MTWLQQLNTTDLALLEAAHGSPSWAVPLFYAMTLAGSGWAYAILLPWVLRPQSRKAIAWLVGASLAAGAVTGVIKLLVQRVRPCNALAWCSAIDIAAPTSWSFPSGHATGSFAVAGFVAMRAPRWLPLAMVYAILVGWSRCVLGVHYPSDVFAGAIIGTLVGAVIGRYSAPQPVLSSTEMAQ